MIDETLCHQSLIDAFQLLVLRFFLGIFWCSGASRS
jgi:hypothetical protein